MIMKIITITIMLTILSMTYINVFGQSKYNDNEKPFIQEAGIIGARENLKILNEITSFVDECSLKFGSLLPFEKVERCYEFMIDFNDSLNEIKQSYPEIEPIE